MSQVRVLVVEDNSIVAEDIQRSLEDVGFIVPSVVGSYQDAINASEKWRPDIVLMDIKLTGEKTGIDAAEVIRQRFNLPVVFLTANSDAATVAEAKKTLPFGFIIKPFRTSELQTGIEMALYRFGMENRIRKNEAWLTTTLQSIGDAIIATDKEGRIVFMNSIAEGLTGWGLEESKDRPIQEIFKIININTGIELDSPISNALELDSVVGLEPNTYLIQKNGSTIPVSDSAAPIKDDLGIVHGAVLVFRDNTKEEEIQLASRNSRIELEDHIKLRTVELAKANEDLKKHVTELQLAEEWIRQQAYRDPLTGLPNRLLFIDRLQTAVSSASRKSELAAVIYLNLDNFQFINDTLGHAIGDNLLLLVKEELLKALNVGDTLARQSGDEFMILLAAITDIKDVINIAEKIKLIFEQPWTLLDSEYFVTASFGISTFPDDSETGSELLQNAEIAMHRAKESGQNNYQLFNPGMHKKSQEKLRLDKNFRLALQNNEFIVHYQPQMDIRTESTTSLEAFVRWQNPNLGLISPLEFIPFAEESGLILKLGEYVLHQVLLDVKAWTKQGMPFTRVAVNISAKQFQHKGFLDSIIRILGEHSIPARMLEIEITESALMSNLDRNYDNLCALIEMGVSVSLDDFGTGFSSLNYLKTLPIQTIKIDRSFVKDLMINDADVAIIRAIISMAKGLNKNIVAEGVETEDQKKFLINEGCNLIQGYLISKPLPFNDLIRFVNG